jgi:hypothetical protein
MKTKAKKLTKGRNKFIRLDEDNLKFVIKKAKEFERSQNWIINECVNYAKSRSGTFQKDSI